jgi:hypothetical protein
MHKPPSSTSSTSPTHRHVRLRLPEHLYKALRHRAIDAGPETALSDVIVELLAVALGDDDGTP